MSGFLYVAFGGALGASARYGFGLWAERMAGASFPYGTLGVNILGSFFMGLLAAWLTMKSGGSETMRLLLGVGILGGFTTFSSFSLDAMNLLRDKGAGAFLIYIAASVGLSLLAIAAGLWLMRRAIT